MFVQSAGYKNVFGPGVQRGERWSTGVIPITSGPPFLELKGTFGESASTAVGPAIGGGALVAAPQVIPGFVPVLSRPVSVEQALGARQATGASVRAIVEGTATSGAAGVMEAAAKPESTIGFVYSDEPIRKIATFLPVSEEMLEDAPAVQPFVNSTLIQFVQLEAERQLLRGNGTAPELQGLLTGRSVPVYAGGTAAGNKAEQLFKAMNGMRGSAYVEPEWMILNPSDYQDIRLLKDSQGQLYGGGPFFGPYGVGAPAAASGQITGATDTLWGKPTYVTSALGAGTALVGTRAGAAVWSRGGVSVEASNSHDQFFRLNLVAIRAERRLGLVVYRPTEFVEVRLS
jgi:HK97 family phage major capsid protein